MKKKVSYYVSLGVLIATAMVAIYVLASADKSGQELLTKTNTAVGGVTQTQGVQSEAPGTAASASTAQIVPTSTTQTAQAAEQSSTPSSSTPSSSTPSGGADGSVTINFAGDLLMHDMFFKEAKKDDGTYDFTKFFEEIGYIMKAADFTVANLESTFAGSEAGYSGYPRFNTPASLADTMKNTLGVDMVVTANNHCNDKGYDGLVNTINEIENRGMLQTGTFKDKTSSQEPLVIDVKGIKISIINYTYSLNGKQLSAGKEYAANMLDLDKVKADASSARAAGAEFIICMPHWGIEYNRTESKDQQDKAKWIFENTEVDMIVGGHPHVVQPADYITVTKDGKEKTGYILYSLGNFISSHATRTDYADTGIILHVALERVEGTIKVRQVEYTPVVLDYTPGHVTDNCVVRLDDAVKEYLNGNSPTITKAEYDKFMMYRNYYKSMFEQAGMSENMSASGVLE